MSRRDHFKKLQKERYKKRKYKNPYFEAKKKTKHSIKTVLLVIIIAALLGLLGNFLLRSPIYSIAQVRVSGAQTINPEELAQIADDYLNEPRLFFASQRNRFLFDANGLQERLENQYSFEKLELKVKQNDLLIELSEKTSELLWISREIVYLADLNGLIIRELNDEELLILNAPWPSEEIGAATNDIVVGSARPHRLKTLPKFRDLNDLGGKAGQKVLTFEEIQNIFRFHELLQNMQIKFYETRIDRLAGKWMSVLTESGYDILFDATGNIEQQAKNLEIIRRESIKDRPNIQYIDLRFGDRVYFK